MDDKRMERMGTRRGGSGVLFFRLGLEVCVSRMTTILRDDTRVSPGSERERVEEKLTVLAGFAVG
jgi:hypothetical protein